MSPELTAKRISEYLTLGSHHNTPEGQEAIANIVLDATKNLSDNLHLATETERFALKRLDQTNQLVKIYLSYSSLDGKRERQELRKQLAKLVNN